MPLVNIYLQDVWDDDVIRKISDDIHESLVDAFKIPQDDYNHRIMKLDPAHYIHSGRQHDKCIFITIFIFPGRSKEAKRKLYAGMFERLSRRGIKETDIIVVLSEPSLENWGLRGKPADEIDIGFNLNV